MFTSTDYSCPVRDGLRLTWARMFCRIGVLISVGARPSWRSHFPPIKWLTGSI